jgi:hypothetical protein
VSFNLNQFNPAPAAGKRRLRTFLVAILFLAPGLPARPLTFAAPTNGLVAYYPLEGDAKDFSGNGNNGTISAAIPTADRFGNIDSAMDFNGLNASIQAAIKGLPIASEPRSVALWVKAPRENRPTASLVEWGSTNSGGAFGITIATNGSTLATWNLKTNGRGVPSNFLPNGNWHHLAATYGGATLTLYLDGRMLGRATETLNTADSTLQIGAAIGSSAFFHGSLAEIRVYNRELSNTEVQELAGVAYPIDSDNDGLTDTAELLLYHTDPVSWDSDLDFFSDGAEVAVGKNPLDPKETPVKYFDTYTGLEVQFFAEAGKPYVIRTSPDLKTWDALDIVSLPTNGVFTKFYSTRLVSRGFYRVEVATTNNVGTSPGSLVDKHLQLFILGGGGISGAKQTSLSFVSGSEFKGRGSDSLSSGNYTYSSGGSTGSLHMNLVHALEGADVFYDLRLTYSSATSGTFSGSLHYYWIDHPVFGTFSLTPLSGGLQTAEGTKVLETVTSSASRISVHKAIEIEFFPVLGKSYIFQSSSDLKTWETFDTIEEAPTLPNGLFNRFYSIKEPAPLFYRVDFAPPTIGQAPPSIIGKQLQLSFEFPQPRDFLDFTSVSEFTGERDSGSGNYTYAPGGTAATLRVDFTDALHPGHFYVLTLSFTSPTAGSFRGTRHYDSSDNPIQGTFILSPI